MPRAFVVLLVGFCVFLLAEAKISSFLQRRLDTDDLEMPIKIWVSFTDKGLQGKSVEEMKEMESSILLHMHDNAIKRRQKISLSNVLLDEYDFPVLDAYMNELAAMPTVRISKPSRWLNAVSIWVEDKETIYNIVKIPFVRSLEAVRSMKREREEFVEEKTVKATQHDQGTTELSYGGSYDQLEAIGVPSMHEKGFNGEGVIVLILDSGFNLDHPAIIDLDIVAQYDFVNDDDDVSDQTQDNLESSDPENHGTATFSTLGGKDEGEHYGPAFGASFLLAKTEDVSQENQIEEDFYISAVEWGEGFGADILSSSLGYQDWYTYEDKDGTALVDTVIDFAVEQRGMTVFVSVGNEHRANLGAGVPGDCIRAFSVGATSLNGDITSFSSQGPTFDGRIKPEICAPGANVNVANYQFESTDVNYVHKSGTSFSCPLAAGVAAVLLQAHPTWKPIDIHKALTSTASQADSPDNIYGWGIINATAANMYQSPSEIAHEYGICDDYSSCHCDSNHYGPYCENPFEDCSSYCIGGYCDDNECHCDTLWEGKVCVGQCEINESSCVGCLRVGCGYCGATESCVTPEFSENCDVGYSDSYCEGKVQANSKTTNVDAYFALAVIVLCFAILLVATACSFFFCIVRPQ